MAPLCEIKFENQNSSVILFRCGETLRCNIILNLAQPRKVKAVSVTISGRAKCNWSVQNNYGETSETTYYTGQEIYLNTATDLLGGAMSEAIELKAGVYTYSFVYDIPSNLPSTVEGAIGNIRYCLRVTINRPFPHMNDNFKQNFIVMKPFDLNSVFPTLSTPLQDDLFYTFGCCTCKSAPFSVVASVPQAGYIPGQLIKVSIKANNRSRVTINLIKLTFYQVIEYFSDSPPGGKWFEYKKVTDSLIDGVPKNETKTYELIINLPFGIVPTDVWTSKTIHVSYGIKLYFKTNWLHKTPTMFIPITIGTIPLGASEAPATVGARNSVLYGWNTIPSEVQEFL